MFNIKETPLPDYTKKEEIINCLTHLAGVPVCIIMLIGYLVLQAGQTTPLLIFSTFLFMISSLIVFAGSAIYHGLKPCTAKRIMRVVDHCNIYIMIAGSVSALFLTHIYEERPKYTLIIIAVLWVLSIIGIVLTFADLKKFNIPQIFTYVGLGLFSGIAMKDIWFQGQNEKNLVMYIAVGGLLMTVGAGLYLAGKKHRYFHSVFHVFILAGMIIIYIGTYKYYEIIFA